MKKTVEPSNLEDILSSLGSNEARNIAISRLIGKVDLPAQMIDSAIKDYEKAGWYSDAAKVALKAGMTERAEKLRELVELINKS